MDKLRGSLERLLTDGQRELMTFDNVEEHTQHNVTQKDKQVPEASAVSQQGMPHSALKKTSRNPV